jgi:hypothetical protein
MLMAVGGTCAIALVGAVWAAIETWRIGNVPRSVGALVVGVAAAVGLCLSVYALRYVDNPMAWLMLPGCRFNLRGC